MLCSMHNQDCLHILVDILSTDHQSIPGYTNKNQHHLIHDILRLLHTVKGCKDLQAYNQ